MIPAKETRQKIHLCARVLAFAATAFMVGGSLLFGYWYFWDRSSPLVLNSEVIVPGQVIHTGDSMIIRRDYCITGRQQIYVERFIVGRQVHQLPLVPLYGTPGCQVLDFTIWLPISLPAGSYTYASRFIFDRNPFQRGITLDGPAVNFDVLPK